MQQFLSFWNTYNVTIIEVLIAIIVLTVASFLFTLVFGKKDEDGDSTKIEKTLQKILEAQGGKIAVDPGKEPLGAVPGAPAAAVAPAGNDELAKLRASLAEKDALIEQLKAANSGAAEASLAVAIGASEPASADERITLEARIKELEGNLAEYEIISEDIADLSRYKEENARLLKQLEATGATPAPAPLAEVVVASEPVAASIPTSDVTAVTAPPTKPEAASAAASTKTITAETPAAPTDATATAAPDTPAQPTVEAPTVVDDELMKEFAAAVEGQKNPAVSVETDKLMNDFENFMKKG